MIGRYFAVLALAATGLATGATAIGQPLRAEGALAKTVSNEAQARAIVSRMSLERKVAQLVMPDISTITPDDVRQYRFGTILNGGNSGPGGDDLAPALEAGTDVMVSNKLGLFMDVKKAFLRPTAYGTFQGNAVVGKTRLDPWVFSGGLAVHF